MKNPIGLVKAIKMALIGGWIISGFLFTNAATFSETPAPSSQETQRAGKPRSEPNEKADPADFVGSETCRGCHEDQFTEFAKTPHARLANAGWEATKQGCESCHGPGRLHVEGGGDKTQIRTFANLPAKQASETCLSCHAGKEEHNNYRRGEHWRNDVGCIDCHSSHSRETTPVAMLVKPDPQLCIDCHNEMRAQFNMPFHHRVLEGAMNCSDCHNPHGGFEQKQMRLAAGSDSACINCHTDKQGPFVYEHAPIKIEGCAICHTPHGSQNPKLLKRSDVMQLCIECHSNVGEIGAPGTPSFHNLASPRFRDCTVCHVKIHGSNTHPFFFR